MSLFVHSSQQDTQKMKISEYILLKLFLFKTHSKRAKTQNAFILRLSGGKWRLFLGRFCVDRSTRWNWKKENKLPEPHVTKLGSCERHDNIPLETRLSKEGTRFIHVHPPLLSHSKYTHHLRWNALALLDEPLQKKNATIRWIQWSEPSISLYGVTSFYIFNFFFFFFFFGNEQDKRDTYLCLCEIEFSQCFVQVSTSPATAIFFSRFQHNKMLSHENSQEPSSQFFHEACGSPDTNCLASPWGATATKTTDMTPQQASGQPNNAAKYFFHSWQKSSSPNG